MKLTFNHLKQLQNKGYSLDIVFMLKMIQAGEDVETMCKGFARLEALHQSLLRKGLLSEKGEVTLSGKELIDFLDIENDVKLLKKDKSSSPFDLWWSAYPATDTFTYKEVRFTGSRSLKAKKDECKIKLDKILNEGEYTISDLVNALEFEVLLKKENSFKTNQNKLSFMQNSLTYLNQRTFESFIELIKEGNIIETKQNYEGVNI